MKNHERILHHSNKNFFVEPNKEKTEHNGSVPSGDSRDAVVKHSPKSVGSLMSPGPGPPGSVALPGLTTPGVTVSNGSGPQRALYSPDSDSGSPPTPQPPGPPGHHGGGHHHQRPVSLGNGGHRASGNGHGKSGTSGGTGKKTRWLLCYHMGGGAPSASPSPPSEGAGNSQCSTPSPTDHGFKLPNSFSNERPTSLPVALLNCGGGGGCSSSDSTLIPHHSNRGVVGESKLSGYPAHNLSLLHALFGKNYFFLCTFYTLFFIILFDPV